MELIKELPADVKENTTHYIQELIDEGKEETKRKAVQKMLLKKMDIHLICDVLDVSEEFVLHIQKNKSTE